jgi:hypothetical protein
LLHSAVSDRTTVCDVVQATPCRARPLPSLIVTLDHATLVVASLALLVAIAAAYFSYQQWQVGKDNAIAAEGSRQASERAADAANESAQAAQRTARADLERDHLNNKPEPDGSFVFKEDRIDGSRSLFYEFKLRHEYEMTAQVVGLNGQPFSAREVSLTETPNLYRIFVERWPKRDDDPWPYRKLVVRFWPPDPAERSLAPWTCECGRETRSTGESGHWNWTIPIDPPKTRKAIAIR